MLEPNPNLQGLLFSVLKLLLRLKQFDLLIAASLGGKGGGGPSTRRLQKDLDLVRVDPLLLLLLAKIVKLSSKGNINC